MSSEANPSNDLQSSTLPEACVQKSRDKDFLYEILLALPKNRNYILNTGYFATKLDMKPSAFKKRLERISDRNPNLNVLKASESTKYSHDPFTVIAMSPATPKSLAKSKTSAAQAAKPAGVSKAKPNVRVPRAKRSADSEGDVELQVASASLSSPASTSVREAIPARKTHRVKMSLELELP